MLDDILKGPKIFKVTKANMLAMIDVALTSIDEVLPGYVERAERDRPDGFFRQAVESIQQDRIRYTECRALVGDGPWEMGYEDLARLKNEFGKKTEASVAEKAWDRKNTDAVAKTFERLFPRA